MKEYVKELFIFLCQVFTFYILPLFVKALGPMGFVFLIIIITLALSFVLGIWSKNKIKGWYPIATALVFLPSVFIYYNESALIHSVWYLAISSVGLFVGTVISISLSGSKKDENK